MWSPTSGFREEVTQTLLFKHLGAESNDLPLSSLLWLRGAASRCGKRSQPRPLLVRGSGHAEARGEAAGASLQKEYFGCGGRGAGTVPAVLPAPTLCALRLPAVPRSLLYAQRSRGAPAPSQRGAGRGCGAGGTSDSALLARAPPRGLVSQRRTRCAQSAAGRQPWRSDVFGALASVRARPLTTRVRALVATSLLSTRRQWTREPPRRSTVGAAPVAADAGLGRVDARGRRCSWPGSGLRPGRGHLRFQSRMRGPAASLLRLGTGAHVESQQDRQRGPRLSWWPQVLDEGSKSHPLQTFLPRFQDVFLGL